MATVLPPLMTARLSSVPYSEIFILTGPKRTSFAFRAKAAPGGSPADLVCILESIYDNSTYKTPLCLPLDDRDVFVFAKSGSPIVDLAHALPGSVDQATGRPATGVIIVCDAGTFLAANEEGSPLYINIATSDSKPSLPAAPRLIFERWRLVLPVRTPLEVIFEWPPKQPPSGGTSKVP